MKSYEIKLQKIKGTALNADKIDTSQKSADFARQFYSDDIGIYESMFMIVLNRAMIPIGWSKLSQGGTCQTNFDAKIMCKIAIDSLADAVILIHNHPSGGLQPSKQDDYITNSAKETLKLFDITLMDHLILSENNHYSYSDNGRL